MRPDTLSGRLLQVYRLSQEPILVEVARPSIWQLRGTPGARGINNEDEDETIQDVEKEREREEL